MKSLILDSPTLTRVPHPLDPKNYGDGRNGAAIIKHNGTALRVLFSDGGGWDHISVSLAGRTPTWEEMCVVKDLFFEEDETVVQYHPRKTDYKNCHPYCLHLWRYQFSKFPCPDPYMVAP